MCIEFGVILAEITVSQQSPVQYRQVSVLLDYHEHTLNHARIMMSYTVQIFSPAGIRYFKTVC